MTIREYRAFKNQVNDILSNAKNSVKYNKCLKMIDDQMKIHSQIIDDYIKEQKHINRLNAMHDTLWYLEDLYNEVDRMLSRKNWSVIDWQQHELVINNID